jgi:O-antigen/teichoic acid export membrane protein
LDKKKSYKEIFKATSIFGGVQVFIILIGIVRVKFVALLLGAAGVGLIGLLQNFVTLSSSLASFGIQQSGVKFIAEIKNIDNQEKITKIIRSLIFFSAILGFLLCIIFAKEISILVFENFEDKNINIIRILSFAVFFFILESGEQSVLQGLRQIKKLAKARIISSLVALIFSLPIYYFFGLEGVSYTIVLVYLINFISASIFSRYFFQLKTSITFPELVDKGKSILSLGVAMALSTILMLSSFFYIKTYISNNGGLNQLGFYEAGFVLVNSYASLIFMAMAKDYFPRLSLENKNNKKLELMCNQQIEIGILILFPVIVTMLVFMSLILNILYTKEFLVVKPYLYWAFLGVLFKLVSWSQSYIILAKGKGKVFISYEIVGSIILIASHILGYKYLGLEGLGIGYLIFNIIYFIIVLSINYFLFKIKIYSNIFILFMIILLVSSFVSFYNFIGINDLYMNLLNLFFVASVLFYSIYTLNKKIGLLKK